MNYYDISVNCWYIWGSFDHFYMEAIDILISNIDRLCQERGWKRYHLAKKMGVKAESLSRSLSGQPRINTVEKIAKALDVSIKSLFEDPDAIDGFVSVRGQVHRINSFEEFQRIVANRPKIEFIMDSEAEEDEGLPF